MSIVTPKTNFIDLLSDVIDHLSDCAIGEYGYLDVQTRELEDRCRAALSELEEL
jgi:hypothetical protein